MKKTTTTQIATTNRIHQFSALVMISRQIFARVLRREIWARISERANPENAAAAPLRIPDPSMICPALTPRKIQSAMIIKNVKEME